jgi:hypothetical protein
MRLVRRRGGARLFSQGPALVGVVETAAEFHDRASEGLPGAVEGVPGKVLPGGGADDVGGPDGHPGPGEEPKEPLGAEVGLGRPGRGFGPGLVKGGVAEGGHGHAITLEEEPEGRRPAA